MDLEDVVKVGGPAALVRVLRVLEVQCSSEAGPGQGSTGEDLAVGLDAKGEFSAEADLGAESDDTGNRLAGKTLGKDLLLPFLLPLGVRVDSNVHADIHITANPD